MSINPVLDRFLGRLLEAATYLLGSIDLGTAGRDTGGVVNDVVLIELGSVSVDLSLLGAAGSDLVLSLSIDVAVLDLLVPDRDLFHLSRHCDLSESGLSG